MAASSSTVSAAPQKTSIVPTPPHSGSRDQDQPSLSPAGSLSTPLMRIELPPEVLAYRHSDDRAENIAYYVYMDQMYSKVEMDVVGILWGMCRSRDASTRSPPVAEQPHRPLQPNNTRRPPKSKRKADEMSAPEDDASETPSEAEDDTEDATEGVAARSDSGRSTSSRSDSPPARKMAKPVRKITKKKGPKKQSKKESYERKGGQSKTGQNILFAHIKSELDSRLIGTNSTVGKSTENFEPYSDAQMPALGEKIDAITETDIPGKGGKFLSLTGHEVPNLQPNDPQSLHPKELQLVAAIGMSRRAYETQKRRCFLGIAALIGANRQNDKWKLSFGISQAQQVCNADVNKISSLYRFWKLCGWIDFGPAREDGKMPTQKCFEDNFQHSYVQQVVDTFKEWEGRHTEKLDGRYIVAPIFTNRYGPDSSDVEGVYRGTSNTPS